MYSCVTVKICHVYCGYTLHPLGLRQPYRVFRRNEMSMKLLYSAIWMEQWVKEIYHQVKPSFDIFLNCSFYQPLVVTDPFNIFSHISHNYLSVMHVIKSKFYSEDSVKTIGFFLYRYLLTFLFNAYSCATIIESSGSFSKQISFLLVTINVII